MQYNILSPDNFPISHDNFTSKKKAREYFTQWLTRYQAQGYYSQTCYNGYRREIPINQIEDYCELITL